MAGGTCTSHLAHSRTLPATTAAVTWVVVVAVALLATSVGGPEASPELAAAGVGARSVDGSPMALPHPDAPAPSSSLTITNFSASPSRVAIGHSTYLNVSVTGGQPPYSYWYTGLPFRCMSADVPSLLCTPSESQQFLVTVQVNDSSGAHVSNVTEVTVWSGWTGPPVILSFVVVPSAIATNHLATIYVNATSSSSLGYFFTGLPPGCASFNESIDQCIPSEPGTYHLRVLVQDGYGIVSTSVTDFVVTGNATPVPPSGTSAAPPGPWVAPAVIGIVVAAVLGGGFYLLRRRGPRGPAS
jgi:hypothetical protein